MERLEKCVKQAKNECLDLVNPIFHYSNIPSFQKYFEKMVCVPLLIFQYGLPQIFSINRIFVPGVKRPSILYVLVAAL